jgi:hypothetical protein
MAAKNPMADPRVVPIALPAAQTTILRDELLGWLAGIEHDLARFPDRLRDPEASVRDADSFRRLLVALDRGEIRLPDQEASSAMERAAEGYDEGNDYARICAVHDAHRALLSLLGGGEGR